MRVLEHGVQGRDYRHLHGLQERQNVTSFYTAEDAKLVLNTEHVRIGKI